MTNITNFQRDMLWTNTSADLAEGTNFAFDGNPVVVTSNVLYPRHGFMQTERGDLGAGGTYSAFGLSITQPLAERVPYRVLGHSTEEATLWGFGFAASIATEITLTDPVFFDRGAQVDRLLCIPEASSSSDILCFFCMVADNATDFQASMAVQNCLSQPDSYSTGVS